MSIQDRRPSRNRRGQSATGLGMFLHAFHALVIGFLLFKFFYSNWTGLPEAIIKLDDLQKYGLCVACIMGPLAIFHLLHWLIGTRWWKR